MTVVNYARCVEHQPLNDFDIRGGGVKKVKSSSLYCITVFKCREKNRKRTHKKPNLSNFYFSRPIVIFKKVASESRLLVATKKLLRSINVGVSTVQNLSDDSLHWIITVPLRLGTVNNSVISLLTAPPRRSV